MALTSSAEEAEQELGPWVSGCGLGGRCLEFALHLSRVARRVRLCACLVIDSVSGLTSFRVT